MAIVRYDKLRLRRIATTDEDGVTLLELSFCPTCGDIERYGGYGCPLHTTADSRLGPTITDAYQNRGR